VTLHVSVKPHRRNIPQLHTHNRIQPTILHHEGVLPLEFSDLSNPHYSRPSDTFTPSSTPQQRKPKVNEGSLKQENKHCPKNTHQSRSTSITPAPPNGPAEVINGRLEHLRGVALGFRNLTHYTIRSLIHTVCLKDHLTI